MPQLAYYHRFLTEVKLIMTYFMPKKCKVQVGQNFEFTELILFLEIYSGSGLAPSSQTVGSLLILYSWQSRHGKWSEHSSIGFDKLKIWPTQTLLKKLFNLGHWGQCNNFYDRYLFCTLVGKVVCHCQSLPA